MAEFGGIWWDWWGLMEFGRDHWGLVEVWWDLMGFDGVW